LRDQRYSPIPSAAATPTITTPLPPPPPPLSPDLATHLPAGSITPFAPAGVVQSSPGTFVMDWPATHLPLASSFPWVPVIITQSSPGFGSWPFTTHLPAVS